MSNNYCLYFLTLSQLLLFCMSEQCQFSINPYETINFKTMRQGQFARRIRLHI